MQDSETVFRKKIELVFLSPDDMTVGQARKELAMTTKKEHLDALRRHDWSYMMSDDGSVYRRGAAEESALLTAEKNNPELKGMYETYRKWWWDLADGSNTIDSGKGRRKGMPEPTFDI